MNDRDCPNCIRNIPGQGCTSWDCKYINRVDAIKVYEGFERYTKMLAAKGPDTTLLPPGMLRDMAARYGIEVDDE